MAKKACDKPTCSCPVCRFGECAFTRVCQFIDLLVAKGVSIDVAADVAAEFVSVQCECECAK